MKKKIFRILRISLRVLLIIAALVLGYFITVIVINSRGDYKPPMSENLTISEGRRSFLFPDQNLSVISWNIGYCALGKEMDFFYDGGKSMRPDKELYKSYLNSVFGIVTSMDSVDFVLLQEVDFDAHRSFRTPQDCTFMKALPLYSSVKAVNYDVPFVPFPLFNPMGHVNAGMMSFSRFIPEWAQRIQYPGSYSWPMSVFFLDRCFIIMRYDLENGKDLYMINTHNSAFSDAGDIRAVEMQFLKSYILDMYSRGHYVVVGGDWNQNPPGFNPALIKTGDAVRAVGVPVDTAFLPKGWKWIYDPLLPSNRDVDMAYTKGTTTTTILDYYLVSPNIVVNDVHTIDMGFAHADHQPVYLNFSLLPDTLCCDSVKIYEQVKAKMAADKGKGKKKTVGQ